MLCLWEYIFYWSQNHVSLHTQFYYWNFSFQKQMATKDFWMFNDSCLQIIGVLQTVLKLLPTLSVLQMNMDSFTQTSLYVRKISKCYKFLQYFYEFKQFLNTVKMFYWLQSIVNINQYIFKWDNIVNFTCLVIQMKCFWYTGMLKVYWLSTGAE